MGDNGESAKERAHDHDVFEASVLARALSYDETFRGYARELAVASADDRRAEAVAKRYVAYRGRSGREAIFRLLFAAVVASADDHHRRAEELAKRYVPYQGRNGGRDAIVRLLLAAAEPPEGWWSDPERIPAAVVRLLLDQEQARALGMSAVWVDAPLEESDAARRRNRVPVLEEGAQLVARRGARRCFECCAELRKSKRRSRTDYCSLHDGQAVSEEARRRSRENAIREALYAASGHRRARRARARSTSGQTWTTGRRS